MKRKNQCYWVGKISNWSLMIPCELTIQYSKTSCARCTLPLANTGRTKHNIVTFICVANVLNGWAIYHNFSFFHVVVVFIHNVIECSSQSICWSNFLAPSSYIYMLTTIIHRMGIGSAAHHHIHIWMYAYQANGVSQQNVSTKKGEIMFISNCDNHLFDQTRFIFCRCTTPYFESLGFVWYRLLFLSHESKRNEHQSSVREYSSWYFRKNVFIVKLIWHSN